MERRTFIKTLGIAGGIMVAPNILGKSLAFARDREDFILTDLHVHLTDQFTIDHVMEIAEKRNVKFGIVAHPVDWAIQNDADLKKYIDSLKQYPVYIGLQPVGIGWTKNYSPELLKQLDYILMDPQTIPQKSGKPLMIWEYDTYIENTDVFMQQYMDYTLNILQNEPINIFAWPLFLPVCIARDYYKLWTDDRMQQILMAAKARNIAIEINDMSHTPHERFISMGKEQGLKFTFGSDARNDNAGRLDYCKSIVKKCGLKLDDFYVPGKDTLKFDF